MDLCRKLTSYVASDAGATGKTSYGRIISLSSCSKMWQCQTQRPAYPSKRAMIRVTICGCALAAKPGLGSVPATSNAARDVAASLCIEPPDSPGEKRRLERF